MGQARRSRGSGPGTVPGQPPYGQKKLPEMQVLTKAKELELHSIRKSDSSKCYPKKYRFTLVSRIQDEALNITDALLEVNDLLLSDEIERPMRFRAHRTALRACRKLLRLIELSHELGRIDDDAFAYWSTMASDVRNMAAAWYKSDMRRAQEMAPKQDGRH